MKGKAILGAGLTLGALFAALEAKASRGKCPYPPDVLLILGCRVRGSEPEPMLHMRAERAAQFLKQHPACIAVCCGGIVHDDQQKSEAQAIREILLQNGISADRILLEDQSQTTYENFVNARRMLEENGIQADRPAFLSSDFHLLRASLIGRLAGVRAGTVAAPSPQNEKLKNYLREALVFPLLPLEYWCSRCCRWNI